MMLLPTAQAGLLMNGDDETFIIPIPAIVNADAKLPINQLELESGDSFNAGDCFEIEFGDVELYQLRTGNQYEVLPNDISTCDLTPAATCEKKGSNVIKFTLTEGGSQINGQIGNIKSPYSVLQVSDALRIINVRYY